ncbi:helix-turn-helix domain-containing protein [Rhizobium sp. S95]|uniref:Helix-turn-helix domain-containing protein n=1 Tax=Ciceribacter sichuanensis TaxID=2949647 RepID=A0AAJ1FKY9_9HYPH|nr:MULTISPECIES: helix-turn-helix domain-containing protein [unclassified Ciceribacter]MCM2399427.1 helix-turn-helix domain-containing protein [Ciceribacter sp. S95]MCO5959781.1 helix-turn-helix domain-containing protein [Ciceribacter sp. S101]
MTDTTPRLIGRKDAAAYCGISQSTFSMWVATNKMPPAILGTRKWDRKAIDARLDEISGLAVTDNAVDEFEKWSRERDARKARGGKN